MSDDTDDDVPLGQPSSRRKVVKRKISSDSSTSSNNDDSPILRTKKNARNRIVSDSDSDSSDNFSRYSRKRKKVALITSDSEDDSDGSDLLIIRKSKRVANIVDSDTEDQGFKCSSSQWETDQSDNEENIVKNGNNTESLPSKNEKYSSDSDSSERRRMEECTICLLPIDKQEVGNPESCNHLFCLACILEWSKNVNTCPIDRQEYRMIFIKNRFNGNIMGKIPIERPRPPEEPQEDPILCEICGLGDREDRLLLCDGCDLGFHLECLMPEMNEIPEGSWYCNVCAPSESVNLGVFETSSPDLLNVFTNEDLVRILRPPRRRDTRLNPRSSQTERIISRIANHRSSIQQVTEQLALPSSSSMTTEVPRRQNVTRKKPKKSKKRTYRRKYRMVYEIDELTGDVISKKKQVRVRKGRRRNRRNQAATHKPAKTVKKRLAQQLGICPMRLPNQSLPDVRVPNNSNAGLNNQRFQAGIPTLHLFGQRDEIDYFSASEEEDVGGPDYLLRRRAHHGDVALFRRQARRKGVALPQISSVPTPSSTLDLLGSIMNSQSQLFSKDVKLSVDNSGKLKIENTHKNTANTNNNKPDLKNFDDKTKKTPFGGNNRNNERRNNQQPYTNPPYQGSSYYPYDNYASSTSESFRSYSNSQGNRTNSSGGGGYDQDMPQDYTQSTLSSYDRDVDSENSQRNEQSEDSDIDIYSDIEESVSTTKIEEEGALKPLNLAPSVVPDAVTVSNNGSDFDNENNDSEDEMVIDTEKVETPTQDEEEDAVKEETAVSSSEDTVVTSNVPPETAVGLHSTSDNQPDGVESTFDRSREEEDDDDEDGCPNFNIYSTESINLAKNTDISLNPEENNQVVSSTPLPEPPKPPPGLLFGNDDVFDTEEGTYDPEAAYNSEKESEAPPEEVYDPERVYDTPEDTLEQESKNESDCERKEESSNEIPENSEIPPVESVEDDSSVSAPAEMKEQTDDIEEQQAEETDDIEEQQAEQTPPVNVKESKPKNTNALYSDSEDEEIVKISQNSFIVGDISTLTEDVSEEERSYTPCLDEKATDRSKALEDLGTEMISDDEKNDFDESHEHKTASEGDALEINAKESEIDMIRPEDYEEGEIVDKSKAKKGKQEEKSNENDKRAASPKPDKVDSDKNKNNKKSDKKNDSREKQESFKKLSKSNKERNYRDKEGGGNASRSKEDNSKNKEREKRKDKRKEIERYDVRALIAEKPRRLKDKFGRDIRKSSSRSRSRSYTPKNSPERRTPPKRRLSTESRERKRKKRSRSRRRSSESRSKSGQRKRSLSRSRRRRSRSRSKRRVVEKKKSKDRSKRRKRVRSTSRTYTPSRKRRKDWEERYSRERGYSAEARWTPSLSRSPEIEPARHLTPSWTPPRTLESAAVDPRGLTVILQNDQNKKKKDKRKKNGKKGREVEKRNKRKKKDQTPQPSKEVFASGDNILVSVSFNKENERRERDVFTKKKKDIDDREKKKRTIRRKKRNQELSTIKPVAIIDLERSPFRELTPSPKDIIVLSDEDHVENNVADAQDACDSSQQVASPENVPVYMTGPKTPPEPQVKFSIPSKQPTMRPLASNPLHDPEDEIQEEQEEEDQEMREMEDTHIGPNTPPEPPNSPPSSPDAYDPFEPTKSRSPSPDKSKAAVDEGEKRNSINDLSGDKSTVIPSLTPPIADIQPADSQSSLLVSRDSSKSPDQVGRSNLQSANKAVTVQSFAPAAIALTSTPIPSNTGAQRINILSSTILGNVSSTIPQRVVLPNVKLSPVKISPVKNVVKSTPIKPMPSKMSSNLTLNKSKGKQQNGGNESSEVISLDFDSPYSPGSSDYEDLFEPPPEVVTKKSLNKSAPAAVGKDSVGKPKGAFDSLFETPMNKMKKMSLDKSSKSKKSKGTKIVGVKLDEDHLKILDDLPNSAVEMQVKDKFLKKLNRQERVVEEVKLVLKPYYNKKKIDKEEYKDIMRRAVPKICHNKSGEINPTRIKNLIEAYVKKIRHAKPKVTSSSSYNPLKG
ncbi:PHD and RING finger domain-containing protein 1 [Harmonia axyridis]|uniref:PHD and RING finger domain-containing protein 1 n=1 Tax=Harmonia axyridis TaxID=115357 RepID=UPI001E2758AF|nr:PHD and RING finger domain-containing protein 1 [Harmonia axyridis]